MKSIIFDFIGFGLVIMLPMAITIGFLYLKDRYDNKHYMKGYEDAIDDVKDILK